MTNDVSLPSVEEIKDPVRRRLWLLQKALECAPLEQAIKLARAADAFVSGAPTVSMGQVGPQQEEHPVSSPQYLVAKAENIKIDNIDTESDRQLPSSPPTSRPSGTGLSAEKRDQLIRRLAGGSKNAELAAEFGISPKQVQGIRMGCGREIAKYRRQGGDVKKSAETPQAGSAADDVVRYLRQQDDVVVPEGNERCCLLEQPDHSLHCCR
jgi:hypothetical protein